MGLYESTSEEVKNLAGLHLYQFIPSNCSQRVRIALEEKGLTWTAHNLNGATWEHMQPGYTAIHPGQIVPALVHDGRVYIESNDIITYIDETFAEPALQPDNEKARAVLKDRFQEAVNFQNILKTLSHAILFRGKRIITDEDLAFLKEAGISQDRYDFMADYAEDGASWEARVTEARAQFPDYLARLEAALTAADWLSGEAYGLADIAWIVTIHRLKAVSIALDDYPKLADWYERVVARPAVKKAMIDYQG